MLIFKINKVKGYFFQQIKKTPKIYLKVLKMIQGTNHFMRETYSYGKIRIRLHKDPSSVSELKWHEVEIYRQVFFYFISINLNKVLT